MEISYKVDDAKIRLLNYSLKDALAEGAVLPMNFICCDGPVSYREVTEQETVSIDRLSRTTKDQEGPALRTVLDTELAIDLLDRAFAHWLELLKHSPTSKFLVIGKDQQAAVFFQEHLQKKGFSVGLAISDEGADAKKQIKRFKKRRDCNILSTCGMAYEGLDVPEISHIAFLTNYRSAPWLKQSFGRAIRINPNHDNAEQCASIFLPRDRVAMRVVESIKTEQDEGLKLREETESRGSGRPKGPSEIMPISSRLTDTYLEDLNELNKPYTLDNQQEEVEPPLLPPKQREEILRKNINGLCKKIAWRLGRPFDEFNRDVKRKFGKSRTHMTIDELAAVCSHLESFDLENINRGGDSYGYL
ncbi:helicase-related protein [Gammaproteobacteria bacterium]|nr:helicase-related protein [Gammaproteobacteria bacterium]